jgi:outer membrane immunogenic protein
MRGVCWVVAAAMAAIACTGAEAAPFNWSGWYVSGSAGWGWRSRTDFPPDNYYTGLGANFAAGAGYGGSSAVGAPRYNGFTAAFGLGYNYQVDWLIVGAEYEFLYADLQTNRANASTSFRNGPGVLATAYSVSGYDPLDGDNNRWYGVIRLRAGTPLSARGWIYVTAGAAYRLWYTTMDPSIATYTYVSSVPAPGSPPTATTTYANAPYGGFNKAHAWGWVAGAGFEYAILDDWFLRGEWLHMDFGTSTYLDPVATALTGSPSVLRFRRTADLVRVGVVYRFYGGQGGGAAY